MQLKRIGNYIKIPLLEFKDHVYAEPRVPCTSGEVEDVLRDLTKAVNRNNYFVTPSEENVSLFAEYVFNTDDQKIVLLDLSIENFVGKVKDLSRGAANRTKQGYPEEFLYVFQYGCKLTRRDSEHSKIESENVLLYIKINNRKVPTSQVFIISFHKNKSRQ